MTKDNEQFIGNTEIPYIPLQVTLVRPREDYISMRINGIFSHAKSPEDTPRLLEELNKEVQHLDEQGTLKGKLKKFLGIY